MIASVKEKQHSLTLEKVELVFLELKNDL